MRVDKYKIISKCSVEQYDTIDAICDRYMTLDTISHEGSRVWHQKNSHSLIVVTTHIGTALGYLELLPLIQEMGPLLDSGEMGEEEIESEHILDPATMKYAQYAYIAAIAVNKPDSFSGGCCAFALIAACAQQLLTLYDRAYLKRLYINPTTQPGYALANKMQFRSTTPRVRNLRSSHMYYIDMNETVWNTIEQLHKKFEHLIVYN